MKICLGLLKQDENKIERQTKHSTYRFYIDTLSFSPWGINMCIYKHGTPEQGVKPMGPILTISAHGLKRKVQVHSGRVQIHFC